METPTTESTDNGEINAFVKLGALALTSIVTGLGRFVVGVTLVFVWLFFALVIGCLFPLRFLHRKIAQKIKADQARKDVFLKSAKETELEYHQRIVKHFGEKPTGLN